MSSNSVPATIGPYKAKQTSLAALQVLSNGVSTLQSLESLLTTHFSFTTLSQVQQAFEDDMAQQGIECGNTRLSSAIPASRDAIAACISNLQTLEAWILLAMPAMEDGGNFGVSIQLDVLKMLRETRDSWKKGMEECVAYYDARANALEKLGIEKSTSTTTSTHTQMESTKDEEETEKKTTKTTVTETKTSGVTPETPLTVLWGYHRVRHIVTMDVQLYATLEMNLKQVMNVYASVLDSVEKNYEKLAFPKGQSAGRGRHMMF